MNAENLIGNEYLNATREFTNRFKSTKENRQINHGHVSKIKEMMILHFKNFPPISVNKRTHHIVDGQHRLEAYQKLVDSGEFSSETTIPVMYCDIPEDEEHIAIIDANTTSKNWSLDDFMVSYAVENPEYKKLDVWAKSHSLCHDGKKSKFRYAAAILKGENSVKTLKSGKFCITNEDYKNVEAIHSELIEILEVLNKPDNGSFIESIALSWSKVRTLHPFKTWLKELKAKKYTLAKKPFSNKKDWDNIFSTISTAINIKTK